MSNLPDNWMDNPLQLVEGESEIERQVRLLWYQSFKSFMWYDEFKKKLDNGEVTFSDRIVIKKPEVKFG